MTSYYTLVPAYGRDYKSKALVEAHLLAEKDFVLCPEGLYINLQQFPEQVVLNVRYDKRRKVAVFLVANLRRKQKAAADAAKEST